MRNKRCNIKYITYIIKGKQKSMSTEDAKMCKIDESTIDFGNDDACGNEVTINVSAATRRPSYMRYSRCRLQNKNTLFCMAM